jgi:hypothetical protein
MIVLALLFKFFKNIFMVVGIESRALVIILPLSYALSSFVFILFLRQGLTSCLAETEFELVIFLSLPFE